MPEFRTNLTVVSWLRIAVRTPCRAAGLIRQIYGPTIRTKNGTRSSRRSPCRPPLVALTTLREMKKFTTMDHPVGSMRCCVCYCLPTHPLPRATSAESKNRSPPRATTHPTSGEAGIVGPATHWIMLASFRSRRLGRRT